MTKQQLDPRHIEWQRNLFNSLKDGGIWGLPRSGLFFQRKGDTFVLKDRMPYQPWLLMTEEQWATQQRSDLKDVMDHCRAAGIQMSE